MHKNVTLFFLTIILLLWTVESVFSQTDGGAPLSSPVVGGANSGSFIPSPGDKAEPPREPVSPPFIRKSIRDLSPFYLMKKNGELVPALNMTPEKLDSLMQNINDNQRQATLPDYICESLTLTGVQKGEMAEMELKFVFTVPQKPVIRIPLQLNGVILLEVPKNATGEYLVPQSDGGYILFLKSTDEKQKTEEQKSAVEEQTTANEPISEPSNGQAPDASEEPKDEQKPDEEQEVSVKPDSQEISSTAPLLNAGDDTSSGISHKHEITLKIQVPLQKNQSVYSLNMKLPKALFSQMTLETPFPSVEMRVTPHTAAQSTESLDGGKRTKIIVYSLGTEFQMQWQASESQESNSRIQESFADVHVDIRPGEIIYSANLRLQFANQSPNEFILNLPLSAELLPSLNNEYSFERLTDSKNPSSVQNAVKIRLNNEYQNSAKLTFHARLPIDQTTSLRWLDLMGFSVRGSARQNGCVGVKVDKSYQVIWNPGRNVSRVDELPDTYEGEYQYAFLFSEQPCSLMARIVAGKTHINVQPQYKVFIGEEEMRLDVTWTYNIRGGQLNWLDVDLNGWQFRSIKDIGPENAFTSESREDNGRVSARLAQPTTGTVDMKMTLYASIEPGSNEISFRMPQPCVNSPDEEIVLSPGILYVVSATNVELHPSMDKTEKLVKQNYNSSEMQKAESGELFCYRVDDAGAQFKSSLTVLPQQINVQTSAQAVISSMRCEVEQRFEFSVLYKPVSQALFIGSGALAEMEDLKFRLGGKELNIRKTTDDGNTRITAIIDEPIIGSFDIVATYSMPLSEDSSNNQQSKVELPLISYDNPDAPEDSRIVTCKSFLLGVERSSELVSVTSNELEVGNLALRNNQFPIEQREDKDERREDIKQGENDDNQDAILAPNPDAPLFAVQSHITPHFLSLKPLGVQSLSSNYSLKITVKRRTGMVWDSLTIDKAWIQTWLTPTRRQDAASFRFVSTRSFITLILPPDVDMGSLEILLDSHPTDQFRPEQGQRLVISIPDDGQTHILETSYYFTRPSRGFNKERIQLPNIEESKWIRWAYWSLCVPKNVHLLMTPATLNAEYSWQRQNLFYHRNSVYDFSALEEWSGSRHLPDPPRGANVYLFSGYGQIKSVEVLLVDRSILVAVSSLAVLILGLIFIHIKRIKQIWLFSLLAIGVFFASLWEPELAAVLIQSSALGCALLALSYMFKKRTPTVTNSDSTIAQNVLIRPPAE